MFDMLRGIESEKKEQTDKAVKDPPSLNSQEEKPPAAVQNQPLCFPKEILKIDFKKEKKSEDQSLVSRKLISAVKKHGVDNQEKAREIYENAFEIIKVLITKVRLKEDINQYMPRLYNLLDDVFNQLIMGDNILNNIYEDRKEDYFLASHTVNVLVLSSVLGLSMGFNKSRLNHLGLASVFHDIGMDSFRMIAEQPKEFNEDERNAVRAHITKSLEVVWKIHNISDVVKDTIAMHHERVDGSGYPDGIKSDHINPYAKILGLVDAYEAITHTRPHRRGMNTHMAVRSLITLMKSSFDADVLKIFINKMSVYPIGSIITLDTGELARVISAQPGSPLRPVVMIIRGANGENIAERTVIDLSKQNIPSIKDTA